MVFMLPLREFNFRKTSTWKLRRATSRGSDRQRGFTIRDRGHNTKNQAGRFINQQRRAKLEALLDACAWWWAVQVVGFCFVLGQLRHCSFDVGAVAVLVASAAQGDESWDLARPEGAGRVFVPGDSSFATS